MTTHTTPSRITFQMEGIHAIDTSTFHDGRYLCIRCLRMVAAEAWAKECPGPVSFEHLFGGEGANPTGGRMVPAESAGRGPLPSLNETRPPSPSSPSHED
jgi:hypothetical protein